MTTIAWDGKTLAADRCCGGWKNVSKIFKLKDGRYAAGCGNSYHALCAVVAWMNAGSKADSRPDIPADDAPDMIVIDKKGVVSWVIWPYVNGVALTEPFFAVGSGSEFALGAMAAGANARRAVEIACRFDASSGQGIDAVRVVKPTITPPRRKPARKG